MRLSQLFRSDALIRCTLVLNWTLAAAQDGGRTEPDPCTKVAAEVAAEAAQYRAGSNRVDYMDAQTAFDCINKIPLNATAALSVISIIKEYMVFQSTLSYQKNPPDSYQQPAVDILSGLDRLAEAVGARTFDTQYSFEVATHSLFAQAHDGHLAPEFGLLRLFEWRLLHTIVCVSADGQQLPQVYVGTDTRPRRWRNASPVVELQGEPVFTYVRKYADARNLGTIDPHPDWNKIMMNMNDKAAHGWDSARHAFDSTPIYNGPVLSGRFANGTSFEWPYYAVATQRLPEGMDADWIAEHVGLVKPAEVAPFAGLDGRADVGAQKPMMSVEVALLAGLNGHIEFEAQKPMFGPFPPRAKGLNASEAPYRPWWAGEKSYQAVHRDLFDFEEPEKDAGPVGYIFEGLSLAVLTLPFWYSKQYYDSEISSTEFGEDVGEFISIAKEANVTKVIIDLTGDSEQGFLFHAFDTAKRFFPGLEPSISFRARASPQLNLLGSVMTNYLEHGREAFSSSEWARLHHYYGSMAALSASQTLDADGEGWGSWADFFGPDEAKSDRFTRPTRYNLSSPDVSSLFGQDVAGYGSNQLDY